MPVDFVFPVFLGLFSASAQASIRLGAVVVVDQMRPEYLGRSDLPDGGFRRLRREGAVFTQARHLHIPTETCSGHAVLSTGREPAVHGIVGSYWYDRAAGSVISCVADSTHGIGPSLLRGPTLPDALKAFDPKARVFAVSGKDRAAVVLGGRKADLVLWFDLFNGKFTTSPYYQRPSWLAAFNAELKKKYPLLARGGRVPKNLIASPAYDAALDLLVAELVARERVGRGPSTDLLFVSYSGTDFIGHQYGLEAPEMDAQLKSLDAIMGRLLKRLEKASGGSLVVAFSSDHGAIPAPEDASGKALAVRRLDWDTFGASLEKTLQDKWPLSGASWIVSNEIPHLYLNLREAEKKSLVWPDFMRQAAKELSVVDGVQGVYVPGDIAAGERENRTPFAAQIVRSYDPARAGDLLVIMGRNVLLDDRTSGTSHGTPWDYDARVPLVFWGRGVRAGRTASAAAAVDLAPTLGRLLGLDYPPGEDAAVRTEAFALPR